MIAMPKAATASAASAASAVPEFAVDPFFLAMESGKIQWGDLLTMSTSTIETELDKDERIVQWWTDEYKAAERLLNWETPDLTLRSDIEEHFPVALTALPATEDGRERFVVTFDDRLSEWAATRAETSDEHAEYADWVQTRLVFALHQYSHKYRVELEGDGDDYIVVFAMSHPSAATRRARAAIPTLGTFPITWEQDPIDHTRHLIKMHQKRVSDERVDLAKLANDMVDALLECADCTFEEADARSPHLMVVTIPTAPPPKRRVCECKHCGGAAVSRAVKLAPAPVALAPRPAAPPSRPAVGGAGGPPSPRALDVMRAHRLAWERDRRDSRVHRIRHRSREQETRILAELAKCGDCKVEPTPRDAEFMCTVTIY
jgi:hypothetical protein